MDAVKNSKTQISVRLPDEMLDRIEKMAKKERRNRSNMVEWLLREALRNLEKEARDGH